MERDVLSRESGGGGRRGSNNTLMVWSSAFPREVRERPSFPLGLVHAHGRKEEEGNETLTLLALTLTPPLCSLHQIPESWLYQKFNGIFSLNEGACYGVKCLRPLPSFLTHSASNRITPCCARAH